MWRLAITGVIMLVATGWPVPASAQEQFTWGGVYVGPDFAAGFRQLTFTVADSAQGALAQPVVGPVQPGRSIGVRAGVLFYVGEHIVVGGDVGVHYIDYFGDTYYGSASDTRALTGGGNGWTALVRAGYPIGGLLPYVGVGVITIPNATHVLDGCNTPPCDTSLGEGAGTLKARRLMYVVGGELAITERFLGAAWTVRAEYAHINQDQMVNTFSRTLTGSGVSPGTTVPVTISTPMPSGVLRTLLSVRLGKR
jgi:hypothetical protein